MKNLMKVYLVVTGDFDDHEIVSVHESKANAIARALTVPPQYELATWVQEEGEELAWGGKFKDGSANGAGWLEVQEMELEP